MTQQEEDRQWMALALELSRRAYGLTSPNPMVGAVVVKDGKLVGQGYHHKAGQPHAEPNALDDAGENARGATLYVTLEPCSTWGRTPPCTERIIREGIARVVIGAMDANPAYQGAAVAILRKAGIQVDYGVLEEECVRLNEPFFWWITRKRPYVLLKMAMTLDGKIATAGGDSKWITGPEARERVQMMRRRADAVMVGGATVLADSPSLLVHTPPDWPRQPRRLVWSSRPLPADCTMLHDGAPAPQLCKPQSQDEWLELLHNLGVNEVTTLLLEGGGELAASALKAGIVNKVAFFIAPKILGGRHSRPVVGGEDPAALADALQLDALETENVGRDLLVTGHPLNLCQG